MKIQIQNRRYIGGKKKFVEFIYELVEKEFPNKKIKFVDFFAGTGIVSHFFAEKGHDIIVNDLLFSNYCIYYAFFNEGKIDFEKLKKIIDELNKLNFILDKHENKTNYFSNIYGNKYFSFYDSYVIGEMREKIELLKSQLSKREYYYLITSLMYSIDRIANTVGHFEHYLSSKPKDKGISLKELDIHKFLGTCEIFNEDANILVSKCKGDVVYLDPPYNNRQYINFYHVLENLAIWNKPTVFEGISMKFKRDHLKSDYSKSKAPIVFEDLIKKINAKLIIVSYNNTYTAKSTASNNNISEEELFRILSSKGYVERHEIDYKFFNSGKTNFTNHKEFIYVCKVKENGQQ